MMTLSGHLLDRPRSLSTPRIICLGRRYPRFTIPAIKSVQPKYSHSSWRGTIGERRSRHDIKATCCASFMPPDILLTSPIMIARHRRAASVAPVTRLVALMAPMIARLLLRETTWAICHHDISIAGIRSLILIGAYLATDGDRHQHAFICRGGVRPHGTDERRNLSNFD